MTGGHALGLTRVCSHTQTYLETPNRYAVLSYPLYQPEGLVVSNERRGHSAGSRVIEQREQGGRKSSSAHAACAPGAARQYEYAIKTVTEQQDSKKEKNIVTTLER